MTLFWSVATRIVKVLEKLATTTRPAAKFSRTRDYCPHCQEETEWQVNILHRFYSCTQCRRDPKLSPAHYKSAHRESEATAQDPDHAVQKSIDEPVAEPKNDQEVVLT